MMATKDQERAALKKIQKIVEDLGENSYIGMAMEGVLEDAEENIENDFGNSWRQRCLLADQKLQKALDDKESFREEAEREAEETGRAQAERDEARTELIKTGDALKDALISQADLGNKLDIERTKVKALQDQIIHLKAKLYDLMTAEEEW